MNAIKKLFQSRRSRVIALTFFYALAGIVFSCFHEVWRDEVVPLSIISESHSLKEVFAKTHEFGHPGLWYSLLYLGYQIYPHAVILKIVNIFICISGMYLFFDRAPFSWAQKAVFSLGFFPLYMYPVVNRNYGISMLFIFLVCVLYRDRWRRIIPFAGALFLLCQTHAHSMVTVIAVCCSLIFEAVFWRASLKNQGASWQKILLAATIVTAGVVLCIIQVVPEHNSIVYVDRLWSAHQILLAFARSVFMPGAHFTAIFGFHNPWAVTAVIFILYLCFLRKPSLLVLLMSGVVGLSMFFELIYATPEIRHQAGLFLLIVMVMWTADDAPEWPAFKRRWIGALTEKLSFGRRFVFWAILLVSAVMAVPAIWQDIRGPYSSSLNFAKLIRSHPELDHAVIMGAPESNLESLPYYLSNPIYIYSGQRFAKYRHLTNEGLMEVSLGQYLLRAKQLQKELGKPVVFLLGEEVIGGGRSMNVIYFSHHHKRLVYTDEELKNFYAQTVRLSRFSGAVTDENYSAYLVR